MTLSLKLTPNEALILFCSMNLSLTTLQSYPANRAPKRTIIDNLDAYESLTRKIVALNHERETGMSRPHSDKVFVHAGLSPEAHAALYAHVAALGGGKVRPGSIGEYLSDLILKATARSEGLTELATA